MRFYDPEWDDNVDADYDFLHDEHSSLHTGERNLAYIWDIFDYVETPIDGVLISREQVEGSRAKAKRMTEKGVYNSSELSVPDWLPTVSDCGAWGYKALPFPPYGNQGMLDFYEKMDVTVGVTIDHLVLGDGHDARLYLDERAFPEDFSESDIPDEIDEGINIMVEEWPIEWPNYVQEYEPSICDTETVTEFDESVFDQPFQSLISDLKSHSHAVYREDDTAFRYDLTLDNAAEMKQLFEDGDYSFRLMAAFQGWDPVSYARATKQVLEMGYQQLGIGGIANSSEKVVRNVVETIGHVIKDFERENRTRVDTHVFGFAKADAFDSIGRSGMTSFDSASMLMAAWTGGNNYHLDSDRHFDAIRVRYPSHQSTIEEGIETTLRGQEVLYGLRAFDNGESISAALRQWYATVESALEHIESYLKEHRHDEKYDVRLLRDVKEAFREDYEYGREYRANFDSKLQGRLAKLLRKDDPQNPVPFDDYTNLIESAKSVFSNWTPTKLDEIEKRENRTGEIGTFDQVRLLLVNYAAHVGDESNLDGYEETLRNRPWEECDCTICQEHGIEVAIWRGNNRNRRRGFHNTKRFYEEFKVDLPKVAVMTRGGTQLSNADSTEEFLRDDRPEFWSSVHDLPVAEVGQVTAEGVREWWENPPQSISFAPMAMQEELKNHCRRYQELFIDGSNWNPEEGMLEAVRSTGCNVRVVNEPDELREAVLERLDYDPDFVPEPTLQAGLMEY